MYSASSYSGVTVMASTGQYSAQYPHMAHLPTLTWGLMTGLPSSSGTSMSFMHEVGHMRTHIPQDTHLSNLRPGRPR